MATRVPTIGCDPLFSRAVNEIVECRWRPEFVVTEIPSPQRIAPYSVAIDADISVSDKDMGTGRLILLHDPSWSPAWEGTFRCVTFTQADVDIEMVLDPLLADVGWSWLTESLETNNANYTNASGTVTAVSSRGFGAIAGDPDKAEIEIRASWTPVLDEESGFTPHLRAWQDLLCVTAGIPPLPHGVVQFGSKMPKRLR